MPVQNLNKYVRATDFAGELWTIPSGTDLHRALAIDVALGNPNPVLPIALCRRPSIAGLGTAQPQLVVPDLVTGGRQLGKEAHIAYVTEVLLRIGDYLRLRERVLSRQPATAAKKED